KDQVGEVASGQLSIGVPASWQRAFTSRFVGTMLREHPNIKLRVHEGVSNILRDYLLAGVLDLCIMPFDPAPPAGYAQMPLVREPLIVLGQRSENFDSREPAPLSCVDGARLILPGRPNAITSQVEHMLKRKGMNFNIAIETDTLALCLDLARQGLGVTVVPASAVYDHDLADISWSPLRGLFLTWSLFESLARSHSHAVHEGRKLVHETVAMAVSQGTWHGVEVPGSARQS